MNKSMAFSEKLKILFNTKGIENVEKILGFPLGERVMTIIHESEKIDKELTIVHECLTDIYNLSDRPEKLNKMIPQEIKSKIFALYFLQRAVVTRGTYTYPLGKNLEIDSDVINSVRIGITKVKYAILVTTLSTITDEDAIEIINLQFNLRGNTYIKENGCTNSVIYIKAENLLYPNHSIEIGTTTAMMPLKISDYLRSKGYALPYLNYTVRQLVEEGIFKLK